MNERRVTVFVGHFGSGKTEIALNRALDLAARGVPVTLADLDVVKPYFRSRSAKAILNDAGVELLAPAGAHIHADLPIIVPQIRSHLRETDHKFLLDVGGDEVGARVLGSLSDVIPLDETECILVLNFCRPSTPDPDRAVMMVREIEAVGRVPVTGLISNTHLLDETTPEVVIEGMHQALETSRRVDIPLLGVALQKGLVAEIEGKNLDCSLIALRRIVLPPFAQTMHQRKTGPLFAVN